MKRGSRKNRQLDFWVGVPFLNLLTLFRHRRREAPREIRRVGVICSPALGDTLLFSGALLDVRESFPEAHLTHIIMKQNVAAAEIMPGADERLTIRLTRPFETVRRLRAKRFDVLLDFTSWQRLTAAYTLLAGARWTVGFRSYGQFRSRGFDRRVLHREDCHEVVNFRSLLLGTGLNGPMRIGHAPRIDVPEPLAAWRSAAPFADEPDIVALHLWASGQRSSLREWPEERWIELAGRLRRANRGRETLFLLTGAPSDKRRSLPVVERIRAAGLRCEAFVSPDGLRTLTHVLRRCRVVVSVNTGVMHLAAIAGARVVGINGPNRNGRWGPVGPYAVGVEAPGEGCGYLHLGFNFAGQPTDCMERISVEQVYRAVMDLLAQAPPGSRVLGQAEMSAARQPYKRTEDDAQSDSGRGFGALQTELAEAHIGNEAF